MKRLVMDGIALAVPRTKDKHYLYTSNPSHIHHKSNKIDHYLKIVDFYIKENCPEIFVIEPILGSYEPDIYFKDKSGKSICVEIQITPISIKKMQKKYDDFVKEYDKTHDSKTFVICSDNSYEKLKAHKDFKVVRKPLPKGVEF